jgi:hypothetical protein
MPIATSANDSGSGRGRGSTPIAHTCNGTASNAAIAAALAALGVTNECLWVRIVSSGDRNLLTRRKKPASHLVIVGTPAENRWHSSQAICMPRIVLVPIQWVGMALRQWFNRDCKIYRRRFLSGTARKNRCYRHGRFSFHRIPGSGARTTVNNLKKTTSENVAIAIQKQTST